MVSFEVPEVDVDHRDYSNRQLAAVPLAVLATALAVIAAWYLLTGAPVALGIEFTGGTELIVQTEQSPAEIQEQFSLPVESVSPVRTEANTYVVTSQSTNLDAFERQARDAGMSIQSAARTAATFGASSQTTALYGVGAAFVGMSVVVFLLFRSFVPSVAVIVSAFSDIMIPVALMNLLGIKLSLGTVAALLMLIGYSVDSDILLNNHVLRRRGSFHESVERAMRTGVTMTVTSIVAMFVMAVVASLFAIDLLAAIGTVLVLGLATDLMNTYMLNVSLLRWYKYEGVAR
jgi:preprotein translocase subunit SecF